MKQLSVLFFILTLVYFRTDFFFHHSISAPLLSGTSETVSEEAKEALLQKYHYLGKGKQAFAFESGDGKWVIKFFNPSYFRVPFWASVFPKERSKREKRKKFYLESYQIASQLFKEETGIVYLHMGPSAQPLPELIAEKGGRPHRINLNKYPFVLQKKAEPFYPALASMSSDELDEAIGQFISLVAHRIDRKIGDGEHNVEHNFGLLGGKVVHLDPGRLYVNERMWEPEKLRYEWWSATHRFKKWLVQNHPERVSSFEMLIETHLQNVLQRPDSEPVLVSPTSQ